MSVYIIYIKSEGDELRGGGAQPSVRVSAAERKMRSDGARPEEWRLVSSLRSRLNGRELYLMVYTQPLFYTV